MATSVTLPPCGTPSAPVLGQGLSVSYAAAQAASMRAARIIAGPGIRVDAYPDGYIIATEEAVEDTSGTDTDSWPDVLPAIVEGYNDNGVLLCTFYPEGFDGEKYAGQEVYLTCSPGAEMAKEDSAARLPTGTVLLVHKMVAALAPTSWEF